jgi:hypothetical protein
MAEFYDIWGGIIIFFNKYYSLPNIPGHYQFLETQGRYNLPAVPGFGKVL